MFMAASLGLTLTHETCYAAAYPPAASSSYFPPPGGLLPDDDKAEFPPPVMADDDYFQFQGVVGARAPAAPACGYYDSPPVFDNGMTNLLRSYAAVVDADGRRPMMMMSGPDGTTNGNGGGRRPPSRIGFRTRSEVDVLDDGFKWRKYGKKAVKSSPNPRNYYRCSAEGCGVKKRVERDSHDPRYVVTTYDGVHNHAAPGAYLCQPPTRGATATAHGAFSSPPCSASASAPLMAAPWTATSCDAWEAQLHAAAMAAAAAAHSSESSY